MSLIPIASCAVLWIRARPFLSLCMSVCVADLFFSSLLSSQQYYGHTLLTKAAEEGQSALVEKLLLAGANIESAAEVVN